MELVDGNQKMALICDDSDAVDTVQKTLTDLGYKCHVSDSPDHALERLGQAAFDAIVIGERYGAESIDTNPVYRRVANMPMDQRRNSFVFLVGDSFTTLNAMEAFVHSAHLVVNPRQMGSLGPILRKCLADFELFYRVYRDVSENQRTGVRKLDHRMGL